MTQPDDLKPGMMIAVTGYRGGGPQEKNIFDQEVPKPSFNGLPFRIVSISLPFICVTDGDNVHAIDIREWNVGKVSWSYARAMGFEEGRRRGRGQLSSGRSPDPNSCPRCGERMRQMMVAGRPGWFLACPNCGFNGGSLVVVD